MAGEGLGVLVICFNLFLVVYRVVLFCIIQLGWLRVWLLCFANHGRYYLRICLPQPFCPSRSGVLGDETAEPIAASFPIHFH